MRKVIIPTLILFALALAGCGSSAPSDQTVASALQGALYSHALSYNGAAQPPAMPECSHQSGNTYVCSTENIGYNVTDDGHTLGWQLTP